MYKTFLLGLLLLCQAALLNAQSVVEGALAYQEKDYRNCILQMKGALEKGTLNEGQAAKAQSYLGQCYVIIYDEFRRKPDAKALVTEFPDYALGAYNAFMTAEKLDPKDKYGNKNYYPLMVEALYSNGFDLYQAGKLDEAKAVLDKAIELVELHKYDFMYSSYMIRGFVHNKKEEPLQAIADFEACLKNYSTARKNLKAEDKNIASVYENMAFLLSEQPNGFDAAIAKLQEGEAMFPANEKFQLLKLQLYQNKPEKLQAGLAEFEKALAKEPNNTTILINYGTMLEHVDTAKAIEAYKRAVAAEPNNFAANFNLGGVYIGLAKKYGDLANSATDSELMEKHQAEQTRYLELAFPVMEKASNQKPDNLAAARALFQIAAFLEKPNTAEYKKRYDSLKAN